MAGDIIRDIRDNYARRSKRYDPWDPWMMRVRAGVEWCAARALLRAGMLPPGERSLLDIGCGVGSSLLFFMQLGYLPKRLSGIDLLEDRVAIARSRLPMETRVEASEASRYGAPSESFDVVFCSMLFSSVLDGRLRQQIADNMWRMVKPGGGVLWYDFTWNNPANPDVRGVPVGEIRRLFPAGCLRHSRVTLAPPIGRPLGRYCPPLYGLVNLLPMMRTHVMAWISKPPDAASR